MGVVDWRTEEEGYEGMTTEVRWSETIPLKSAEIRKGEQEVYVTHTRAHPFATWFSSGIAANVYMAEWEERG